MHQEECMHGYASMHQIPCTPAVWFFLFLCLHCDRWLFFLYCQFQVHPITYEKNAFADTHGHTRTPMHILIYTHFRTPTGLFVTSFPGSLSAIEEAWQMGVWER